MYPEDQYAIRTLRAGASGYLTKESAPNELIEAIRRVAQGRKYITATLAERIAVNWETEKDRPIHEELSDREYQVFCLIASGKAVKEIAEKLSLSVKTVSTHRSRILKKMGVENNAQLSYYAIKHNLV
jgi:DNA-binding NarL/FixJ family response regulator